MLKINKVDTYYGHIHALKKCSIHVDSGEFVTLIRANGAGKSTLLKSIIGLEKVTNSTIEFVGETAGRPGA